MMDELIISPRPEGSIPTGHPGVWVTPWGGTWLAAGVGGGNDADYQALLKQAFGVSGSDMTSAWTPIFKQLQAKPGSITPDQARRMVAAGGSTASTQTAGGAGATLVHQAVTDLTEFLGGGDDAKAVPMLALGLLAAGVIGFLLWRK